MKRKQPPDANGITQFWYLNYLLKKRNAIKTRIAIIIAKLIRNDLSNDIIYKATIK